DLASLGNQVTADDVKKALSDREVPVCVPRGSDWMTLGSLVMELSADPELHFAPGPPTDTSYSEIRFEQALSPPFRSNQRLRSVPSLHAALTRSSASQLPF